MSAQPGEACPHWGVALTYSGLPLPFQLHTCTQWLPYLPYLTCCSQSTRAFPSSVSHPKASGITFHQGPGIVIILDSVFKSHVTPSSSVLIFAIPKSNLHYDYSCLANKWDFWQIWERHFGQVQELAIMVLGLIPLALGFFSQSHMATAFFSFFLLSQVGSLTGSGHAMLLPCPSLISLTYRANFTEKSFTWYSIPFLIHLSRIFKTWHFDH